MNPLKTRQERFCLRFVELGCATAAARAAGYAPRSAKSAGFRLRRDPRIVRRIAEIEAAPAAEGHGDGRDDLLGKLETVYRQAMVERRFSAAVRAVGLQARLGGSAGAVEETV
jgi:hypothetical protein